MAEDITPIIMPKWGLSMREGTIVELLVAEGDEIDVGTELMAVETDKIDGTVEAADAGLVRRLVAEVGHTYPVKGLLGVLAEPSVPAEAIDAFIAAYEVPEAGEDEDEGASPYQFAEVSGIRVRYTRYGSGEGTVVLVHGFGGDLDNWLFTMNALSVTTEVVALDLPGHGQSAIALPGATVEELAVFMVAFLDQLGLGAVDLVGHSLGAAIIAQVTLEHPERVASLALIAPAGLGEDINLEYLDGFVSAQSRRDLKPVLTQLFVDESQVSRSLVDGVLRYKRLDGVSELLAELRAGVFPGDRQASQPGAQLDAGRLPVLVVWGAEDRIIAADHARLAPAGATVVVLDGAGHMVQMEKASEVNAHLRQHLSRT